MKSSDLRRQAGTTLWGPTFGMFNSSITSGLKTILIVEPFISILTTFGGIWLIRFVHPAFSYLVIISGILMYGCYFTMAGVLLYELGLKK